MAWFAASSILIAGCGTSKSPADVDSLKAEAFLLYEEGKPAQAIPIARAALAAAEKKYRPDSEELADCWIGLGRILASNKQFEEAIQSFDKALLIYRSSKAGKEYQAMALLHSAGAYFNFDKLDQATERYVEAVLAFKEAGMENSLNCLSAVVDLAGIQIKKGDLANADGFLQSALKACRTEPNVPAPIYCTVLNNIGEIYYLRGEYEDALKYYKEAVEMAEAKMPTNIIGLPVYRKNVQNAKAKLKK
jgi:tetratricopeptide (TPR) repeat protein